MTKTNEDIYLRVELRARPTDVGFSLSKQHFFVQMIELHIFCVLLKLCCVGDKGGRRKKRSGPARAGIKGVSYFTLLFYSRPLQRQC